MTPLKLHKKIKILRVTIFPGPPGPPGMLLTADSDVYLMNSLTSFHESPN